MTLLNFQTTFFIIPILLLRRFIGIKFNTFYDLIFMFVPTFISSAKIASVI